MISLNELNEAILCEKDNTLTDFDEIRYALKCSETKEIIITTENEQVHNVINGYKLTKKMNKRINKKIDIANWIHSTATRYKTYTFVEESRDEYLDICNNIKFINKVFDEQLLSLSTIVKIVYKTDKQLIKLFKKWNVVNY